MSESNDKGKINLAEAIRKNWNRRSNNLPPSLDPHFRPVPPNR